MEMTPKEKAINIFNKCCDYADYTDEDLLSYRKRNDV